jgi:hypothetical protein
MRIPEKRTWTAWAIALLAVGCVLLVGRVVGWDGHPAAEPAQQAKGGDYEAGYLAGLQAGQAQGRQEGRALQAGATVPAGSRQLVRDAFDEGYAAGANDVFTGYDGGWPLGQPYVITLAAGHSPIAYRIASRTPVEPGVRYSLCPDRAEVCAEAGG